MHGRILRSFFDELPFRVRGSPASNTEELPLIVISRVRERIAAENGGGTLRASFQRLSRIDEPNVWEGF